MITVNVKGKSLEEALRIFKRKVKNAKILEIYAEKQVALKPSEAKRLKSRKARQKNG